MVAAPERSARGNSSLLWQVKNNISPEFYILEMDLDASGLVGEIPKFMETIRDTITKTVELLLQEIQEITNALSINRRRLEDGANQLTPQAHQQLIEVQRRLSQVGEDHNRALAKERLMVDVHRRLEAHLAQRRLQVPQHVCCEHHRRASRQLVRLVRWPPGCSTRHIGCDLYERLPCAPYACPGF